MDEANEYEDKDCNGKVIEQWSQTLDIHSVGILYHVEALMQGSGSDWLYYDYTRDYKYEKVRIFSAFSNFLMTTLTRQSRAFSVADPTTWNWLPTTLCQIPVCHSTSFFTALKTIPFD